MGIRKMQVSDITDSTAKVAWETDIESTTELALWEKNSSGGIDPVDINSVTGQGNTGLTMNHIYNLINLTSDMIYRVEAKSYSEFSAEYLPCDDGSSPCEFTTASAQQPVVSSITVAAAKQRIAVGESVDITAKVSAANGSPMQGITVEFSATGALSWLFFWLPPIGTINPKTAQTNTGGEAKTVFTASRRGVAVIKAKAGSLESKINVIIG